jgi:hypothetical protein
MFLAGFILTAAVAAAPVDWSQITPNLPAAQVRQTLGQPKEIKTVAAGEVWYYFADHDTGFVRLKNHRTLGLIVLDATAPTAEQLAAIAPKPAPLPTPPQMPTQPVRPVPVTPPPPAVLTPATAQHIQSPKPESVTPPAAIKTPPKSKSDPGSRYFISCGIGFITLAIIFGLVAAFRSGR